MKVETRIKIELEADESVMLSLERKVARKLDQILDLYEMYGVHNIKIKPLAFDTTNVEWLERE
jgi:hypothetical protein